MRRRNPGMILILFLFAGLLWAETASAIPVFARKYGFNCTMCHSAYPRLNDFGRSFRNNGYRLPGRENAEKTVLEVQVPVALRTAGGYVGESYNRAAGEPDLSDFRLNGLDLLSAGLLGRNVGYMMVYVPQMAESRGVEGQAGALEMANVVFSGLAGNRMTVRAGRFEPAYVPFSAKRQLSVSPYEIYDATFAGGPPLSETQSGLELAGAARKFEVAAGVVDGASTRRPGDTPSDVYARAAKVFGAGAGQTAGQRVGLVGYLGHARPAGAGSGSREPFYRWGVDASLNASIANLALEYLWARDDKALWAAAEDAKYSGGFAEVSLFPRADLACFGRFDHLAYSGTIGEDVNRWTAGGRYYFEPNLALHLEYSYRVVKAMVGDDPRLSFVTTRLDMAF